MKKILISLCLIFSGCTLTVKPEPDVEKALKQHSVILDALVRYVEDCQEKGICPKPENADK